jgi:tetratricopeptide (TPR) repeat protein
LRGAANAVLGTAFASLEDWRRAQRYFDRRARLEPTTASRWIALGESLLRGGPIGPTFDARVGIIQADQGDGERAVDVFQRAASVDPRSADAWSGLSRAGYKRGDLELAADAAKQATRLAPENAATWLQYGMMINALAHRRGGFEQTRLDSLHGAWEAALAGSPHPVQANARFHLLRSYAQFQNWSGAFALAWPDNTMTPDPSPATLIAAAESGVEGAPTDWWFVAAWRLQSLGHHSGADHARQRMAERQIQSTAHELAPAVGPSIQTIKALAALDRLDEARLQATSSRPSSLLPHDALAFEKLLADVELRSGQVGPARVWLERHSVAVDPEAEHRFRHLIESRNVAIVGPAGYRINSGSVIDDHDVVIRTKYAAMTNPEDGQHFGRRTDIAYYSDSSAFVLEEEIRTALSADLSLAVLRPTTYNARPHDDRLVGRVRTMPNEDLAHFQASHFGIQRILYDVLRYRPASVTLFGADFFTGERLYADRYQTDIELAYAPRQLVRVLPMFGHDLAADFRFSKGLHEAGLFRADDMASALLAQSPDAYLALLDANSARQSASYP